MRAEEGNLDGTGGLDEQRLMYYTTPGIWQLLEEPISADSPFIGDAGAADIDSRVLKPVEAGKCPCFLIL